MLGRVAVRQPDEEVKPVYISSIRVSNIRGFHDTRNVDLNLTRPDGTHAGWTVLAGRNGSGKTSLLRAVALAIGGPGVARNLVPDFENWVTLSRHVGTVDVQLVHDVASDKLGGSGRAAKSFWAGLEWQMPNSDTVVKHRTGVQPSLREHIYRGSKTARRGPWLDNPSGWFCAAYGPFRRLAGGAGDTQRLMLSPGPVARLVSLFHEDASLAEGVSWLIEQHLRTLEDRPGARELRDSALAILGDGLLPDNYQIRRVDSDGLWVGSGGHDFPLREMSDGYRTIASLVVDILKQLNEAYGTLSVSSSVSRPTVDLPGVVIIDEIDAHLHVTWQKRIGTWLKTHFPNIQFIVTTHSPYICQDADEGGLIKLPGPEDSEPPRVVDRHLYERVVYGSGDDAILSDLFGLETPYSPAAESLRAELVQLEVRVINGSVTKKDQQRYYELRDLLTSSPVSRTMEVAARLEARGTLSA